MSRRVLVLVVSGVLLLGASLILASCGTEDALRRSTESTTTTLHPGSTSTTATTTTTAEEFYTMTTSAIFAAHSRESMEAALELGDAVISYLGGKSDLATVQSLVTPAAQEGLTQMLSVLVEPTDCEVQHTGSSDPYSVFSVGLLFADGRSRQPGFELTIVIDLNKPTITAIELARYPSISDLITPTTSDKEITTGASLPVIQGQTEFEIQYLSTHYAYYTAEAVVLGTVVAVLPLRLNPLAGTGTSDGPSGHQPIVYKGYVLDVQRAYGPDTIPERITVYALGNGTVVLDGVTYEVREDYPLDADPGDTFLVPLMKAAYFGTPGLGPDEYWVQANWAVFAVDESGRCTRVTGADVDPETGSEYPLSELEDTAVARGKAPSLID